MYLNYFMQTVYICPFYIVQSRDVKAWECLASCNETLLNYYIHSITMSLHVLVYILLSKSSRY